MIITDDKGIKKILGQKQPAIIVLHDDTSKPLLDAMTREAKKRGDSALVISVNAAENPDTLARYDNPTLPALVTLTPAFFGRKIKSTAENIRPADVRAHLAFLLDDTPLPEEKPTSKPEPAGKKDKKAQHVDEKTFRKVVLKGNTPVLVDFWAGWCQPCLSVAPFIDQMADKYAGQVKVVKLNVDENQRLANQYGVQSIPTFILFEGGQPVGRLTGASPAAIQNLIEEVLI